VIDADGVGISPGAVMRAVATVGTDVDLISLFTLQDACPIISVN
jgi:hypothetical protein